MSKQQNATSDAGATDIARSDYGPILHQFRLPLTKKQAAELKAIWRKHGQNAGMILMQPVLNAGPFDLENCFANSFVLDASAGAKVFAAVDVPRNPNAPAHLPPASGGKVPPDVGLSDGGPK